MKCIWTKPTAHRNLLAIIPCCAVVVLALSKSAVWGSIPAHHENVIFFLYLKEWQNY